MTNTSLENVFLLIILFEVTLEDLMPFLDSIDHTAENHVPKTIDNSPLTVVYRVLDTFNACLTHSRKYLRKLNFASRF